jgi:hypothetical protein
LLDATAVRRTFTFHRCAVNPRRSFIALRDHVEDTAGRRDTAPPSNIPGRISPADQGKHLHVLMFAHNPRPAVRDVFDDTTGTAIQRFRAGSNGHEYLAHLGLPT